jgi:hypothetical protein
VLNPGVLTGVPRLTGGDHSENSGAASSPDAPSASSSAKIALEVIRDPRLLIGIWFFIAVISFFLVLKFAFY